mgnify:CR=1 FL=1
MRQKHTDDEILAALQQAGTKSKAAILLGVDERNYRRRYKRIMRPAEYKAPDGYHVKGVSTLHDADGNVRIQWVKTDRDKQRQLEAWTEAAEGLADQFRRQSPAIPAPKQTQKDVLAVYPLGDPHIGMYAWHEETGEDFDCDIAEANLSRAMDILVDSAPPAEQALIVNLGDFYHADNSDNSTRRNKNSLDVDSRFGRVLRVGIRVARYLIERALEKHKKVKVICAIGNHDDESSVFLALILDAFYQNNKRVEIETRQNKFHYHQFGKNLFGVTHGDTVKPATLGAIMTADCRPLISQVEHCHWMIGHIHNRQFHEFPDCTVESFRTLAAKDAWHHGQGYRSGRDMQRIDYHREYGEQARQRADGTRLWVLNPRHDLIDQPDPEPDPLDLETEFNWGVDDD